MEIKIRMLLKYSFVVGLLIFHFLTTVFQVVTSKFISLVDVDGNEKEYVTCKKSNISLLRYEN